MVFHVAVTFVMKLKIVRSFVLKCNVTEHWHFIKEIFKLRETNLPLRNAQKLNLQIETVVNQVIFGSDSVKCFSPKLCNSLPYHLRYTFFGKRRKFSVKMSTWYVYSIIQEDLQNILNKKYI